MFYLFTGQPGSQKTANMIHFVMTDEQFKHRPVFFFNIRECTVPDWEELTESEAKEWYNLPEGSVILIDEAQELFRPQKWDKEKTKTVTGLEKHRHDGIDLVMTTQHPMLINADVRRQVQQHRHYKMPYGVKSSCYVWEKCINDPDDYHAKKEAEVKSGKVPPSVFKLYKSTVLNTHKRRVPKKLMMFFGLVFLSLVAGGYLINRIMEKREVAEAFTSTPVEEQESMISSGIKRLTGSGDATSTKGDFDPVYPLDPIEYIALWTPRIPEMPHTAPVYDELTKPKVAPKTRCYGYHKNGEYHCKCVTQQMTPINMAYEQCVHIVQNGLWDAAPITSATYNAQGDMM